jgi:hypothetical protein
MAMSPTRKASAIFVVMVLGGGTLAAFAPAMLGAREVRRFCRELPLGLTQAQVQQQVDAQGFGLTKLTDGGWAVEHPNTLGRFECLLRFDAEGKLSDKPAPP